MFLLLFIGYIQFQIGSYKIAQAREQRQRKGCRIEQRILSEVSPYLQMEDTMNETQRLPQKPRDTMTIGDWLITFLLTSIPLVGLVALLVWSFDEGMQPTKSTWAKATLIWYVISVIIAVFILLIAWGMRLG
jgi:hypothetical protein